MTVANLGDALYDHPVQSSLNITASIAVKAQPGYLIAITVLQAGGTVGGVYDTTTVSGTLSGSTSSNQVVVIPATVGTTVYDPPIPCQNGITIVPGSTTMQLAAFWT
jgi:hypothetical protein